MFKEIVETPDCNSNYWISNIFNSKKILKMCNSCFSTEIESFEDYQSFEKFDIELIQKIETNNNTFGLKVIETNSFYSGFSFQIVKCNSCGTVWWFSVPDNSWRGFFLKEENAKIKITEFRKFDQRKRFIFVGLVTLLVLIVYLIIT